MANKRPKKIEPADGGLRAKIHEIIFEADTPAGMLFDVALLVAIIVSVVVICLETVKDSSGVVRWADTLQRLHWMFTILFTVEYLLRIACVRKPLKYIFSFWGIIDLLSFLPDYLLLTPFYDKTSSLSVIRSLRLLRVFRIFKLGWFQSEADDLGRAIWQARAKIVVFITVVMIIVTVSGTLMYEIEKTWRPAGTRSDFDSIPQGIYWSIVTMTTVGFGDVVPHSLPGKFLASGLIMLGYSLIIVPTGFVSAEIIDAKNRAVTSRSCKSCVSEGHDKDARYCKYCGEVL